MIRNLDISIGPPIVVAVSPAEERRWGYYQFPNVERWQDATLCVTYSLAPDATAGYGLPPGCAISRDGGRSWNPYSGEMGAAGLLLPNGDRIQIETPVPYKVSDLRLPAPVATFIGTYGNTPYPLYRIAELPAKLQELWQRRLPKGATNWIVEQVPLRDPDGIRYSEGGLFPIIWWGDLRLTRDGDALAGIYPDVYFQPVTRTWKWSVCFYRSTDQARSWSIQGRIPYDPDPAADEHAARRDGFTEPTFLILSDGSLLCIMRTTDGLGLGPMYATRSHDLGRTWTKPAAFAPAGVLPHLLLLENGVAVLSSGRPGVQLRFSADGRGETWTDPAELVEISSDDLGADSCGYTRLAATGPDRFFIVYSDFQHKGTDGEIHKAIKVREVRVKRVE